MFASNSSFRYLTIVVVVSLSACADPLRPPSIVKTKFDLTSLAARELAEAVAGREARGFEDEILRLEAKVPGVGGVFADSNGRFVIYLRDEDRHALALSEFRATALDIALPSEIRSSIGRTDGVLTRRGDFDFSQLVAWSRLLLWNIGGLAGFVSIDADESKNRVRVEVIDEATRATVFRTAQELGIPVKAIVADLGRRAEAVHDLNTTVRPISGSYLTTNAIGTPCTIGWNVFIPGIGKGFITAGHCSGYFPGGGASGASVYQSTYSISNKVGHEAVNPAWNRTDPDCVGVELCTIADAVFVKYDNDNWWVSRISKTDLPIGINNAVGSIEANWYLTPIYSHMDPYVGLQVDKVGRSTGWTRGTVNATCVSSTELAAYGQTPFTMRVLCADSFSNASAGRGDSGAPVFYKSGGGDGIFFVGLLYAREGSAYGPDPVVRCTANCVARFTRYTRIRDHFGYGALSY